jgi:hypothetical protein
MKPKKKQQVLIDAIRKGNLSKTKQLLGKGYKPNAPRQSRADTTPLHEAVRKGRLDIVRALVKAGADVNATDRLRHNPLDLALNLSAHKKHNKIAIYLRQKGAQRFVDSPVRWPPFETRRVRVPQEKPPAPPPEFTAHNLADKFDPDKWVGKPDDMQKLWDRVPKNLKAQFDFAAAFTQAKRATLRAHFPGKKFHLDKLPRTDKPADKPTDKPTDKPSGPPAP